MFVLGALIKEALDDGDDGPTPPKKEPEQQDHEQENIGRWAYFTCKMARLEIQANNFGINYPSRSELIEYNRERKKCAPKNVDDIMIQFVGDNDSPLAFSPLHENIRWVIGAYLQGKDKGQISKQTYHEACEINRIYRG